MARNAKGKAAHAPRPDRRVTLTCENPACRQTFDVSLGESTKRRFCSMACVLALRVARHLAGEGPWMVRQRIQGKTVKACENPACGEAFTVSASESVRRFCCRSCSALCNGKKRMAKAAGG